MFEYKFIDINGTSIAYTDTGSGKAILFVHGFTSYSSSWNKLIECMSSSYRFITFDFKGFGYSEKDFTDDLSLYAQSEILTAFVDKLQLNDFTIVAHSIGAAISLLSLNNSNFKKNLSSIVMINSTGHLYKVPVFIKNISELSSLNPLLEVVKERDIINYILNQLIYDKSHITEDFVQHYLDILLQANSLKCYIEFARQLLNFNFDCLEKTFSDLSIPTLLIFSENDVLANKSDYLSFQKSINSSFLTIESCGHLPQQEKPDLTARYIEDFIKSKLISEENEVIAKADELKFRKIRMTRLFEKLSFGGFIFISVIKFLQFLKLFGIKVEEDGWRKVCGIFLRKEHSKFMLTSFRLDYSSGFRLPDNIITSKNIVIQRLQDFLRNNPDTHWAFLWSFFRAKRVKLYFTDIIEPEFDMHGKLLKLTPYFDSVRPAFTKLTPEVISKALVKIVEIYNTNELKNVSDNRRAWIIYKNISKWSIKTFKLSHSGRDELKHLITRVLNATYINFERLPNNGHKEYLTRNRLSTPNMKLCRHPGFGLLNIVCRFMYDFSELDMWVQYHHVPVDGMPMQEMMRDLKRRWGENGKIIYPPVSALQKPEILYFGNMVFHAKIFVNFEKILKVRRYLNTNFSDKMDGSAAVSAMLMWGLTTSKLFHDFKFALPVDTDLVSEFPQDRNIGLIFMKPKKYMSSGESLGNYIKFQKEFNHQIAATRLGKSESYEFFALLAMLHPIFYSCFNYFFPKTINEVVGTAGITVLKDAEMFISPLTDLHINGFIALGNMSVPTFDGSSAGAVSICCARDKISEYIKTIRYLADNFDEILGLKL